MHKVIVRLGLLLLIFTLAFNPIESGQAQSGSPLADQTWVRLGGPPGGLGYDIRVDFNDPSIMYVTDAFSGVHKSTDNGITWFAINEGIDARTGTTGDSIPAFCLTVDPNDTNILWTGMKGYRGVYRSIDKGATWEKRVNGMDANENLTIRGFSVQPGNSNVVYLAGEVETNIMGRGFHRVKGVVYKTMDAGVNWEAVWRGDSLARYILINPANTDIVYVSTGLFDREAFNSNFKANQPGGEGILKSTDGGITWSQINKGIENLYIGTLAMHPNDPDILIAGADNVTYRDGGGVYLTTNGGESWIKVIPKNSPYVSIMSVDFAPSDPSIVYAVGGGTSMFRSRDGGLTWEAMGDKKTGAKPPGFRRSLPIDLQIDPRNPDRLFINNYGGGNYLSEDAGATWVSASTGYTGAEIWDVSVVPDNPAMIYVNGRSGPFVSYDGGINWEGINPGEPAIQDGPLIKFDPIDPKHIIASDDQWGWTFVSRDAGLNWTQVTNFQDAQAGLPTYRQTGMYGLAFAPSDSKIVYAGWGSVACGANRDGADCSIPSMRSFSTSRDGGTTWSTISTPFDGATVLQILVHPTDSKTIWVTAASKDDLGGVYFSSDGGENWEKLNKGLRDSVVLSLAYDPTNSALLYAGSSQTLWKSDDGGLNWAASAKGMNPNERISAIVVDPVQTNVVYAGSRTSGVFVSEDYGNTWRLINNGLHTRAVTSLAISADGKTLYAGTQGEGVFRLSTHDQAYFAPAPPTPTVIPSTATSAPTKIQATNTSAPVPTAMPETPPASSLPCGSALIAPLFAGLMWLSRRK